MLEGRVVLSFTFAFNGHECATATQTAGTSDASLVFAQTPRRASSTTSTAAALSTPGAARGRCRTSRAVTVDIIEASGASNNPITLGTPDDARSRRSARSTSSFVVSQTGAPTSSSLTIDDSTGTLAGTYSYNGTTFVAPSSISLTNNATQSGGVTIKGSRFSDTYNALGSKTGEPVNFVGNAGTNTVNVGSNASHSGDEHAEQHPFRGELQRHADRRHGHGERQRRGEHEQRHAATLSFASPNETVSGLGFGAGGSLSFNTGTPGTTALNVNQGTNGAAGVTTNVTSTPVHPVDQDHGRGEHEYLQHRRRGARKPEQRGGRGDRRRRGCGRASSTSTTSRPSPARPTPSPAPR